VQSQSNPTSHAATAAAAQESQSYVGSHAAAAAAQTLAKRPRTGESTAVAVFQPTTDPAKPPPNSTPLSVDALRTWSKPQGKAKALYTMPDGDSEKVYVILADTAEKLELGRLVPMPDAYPRVLRAGATNSVTLEVAVKEALARVERRAQKERERADLSARFNRERRAERQCSPGLRFLQRCPAAVEWTRDNFAPVLMLETVREGCEGPFDAATLASDRRLMPRLVRIESACASELIDNEDDSGRMYEYARKRFNGVDHVRGLFLHPQTGEEMRIWVYISDMEEVEIYQEEMQRARAALRVGTLPVAPSQTAFREELSGACALAMRCTELVPSTHASTPLQVALSKFAKAIMETTEARKTTASIGIAAFNAAVANSCGAMLGQGTMNVGHLLSKFNIFCGSMEDVPNLIHKDFEDVLRRIYGLQFTYDHGLRHRVVHGVVHVNATAIADAAPPARTGAGPSSSVVDYFDSLHDKIFTQ